MMEAECRAAQREIDEAELNRPLNPQVSAHIASCAACGAFQTERTSLRELLGSLGPVTAPADFDFRLRAKIVAQNSAPKSFFGSFVLSTPALVGAVVIAVVVLSLVLLMPRRGNQIPVAVTNQSNSTGPIAGEKPPPQTKVEPQKKAGGQEEVVYTPTMHGPQNKATKWSQRAVNSSDFSDSAARVIRQSDPLSGEVSVITPMRPMILSLQDDNGATRRIELPPVSFGSQRLVESRTLPVSQVSPKTRTW